MMGVADQAKMQDSRALCLRSYSIDVAHTTFPSMLVLSRALMRVAATASPMRGFASACICENKSSKLQRALSAAQKPTKRAAIAAKPVEIYLPPVLQRRRPGQSSSPAGGTSSKGAAGSVAADAPGVEHAQAVTKSAVAPNPRARVSRTPARQESILEEEAPASAPLSNPLPPIIEEPAAFPTPAQQQNMQDAREHNTTFGPESTIFTADPAFNVPLVLVATFVAAIFALNGADMARTTWTVTGESVI